jgi:hypothetical protein
MWSRRWRGEALADAAEEERVNGGHPLVSFISVVGGEMSEAPPRGWNMPVRLDDENKVQAMSKGSAE